MQVTPEEFAHNVRAVREGAVRQSQAGPFDKRQSTLAEAELAFYRAVYGDVQILFREPGGSYLFYARVEMRTAPRLDVVFSKPHLTVEPISFAPKAEPTHKVRFWIRDRGGKNKNDDLRIFILSVTLDASL